ncbi:hypothetical protein LXL04_014741 [Taraxacum kok-saghyz]
MSKRSMDIHMGDNTGSTLEGLADKVPINEININKMSNNVQQSSQVRNDGFQYSQQVPFEQQSGGGGGGGGGGGAGGGGGGGGGTVSPFPCATERPGVELVSSQKRQTTGRNASCDLMLLS